jgi:CBS domain-containing protein
MSSLVHLGGVAAARAELATSTGPDSTPGAELVPVAPRLGGARTVDDVMTRFPLTMQASDSMWSAWDRLQQASADHVVVLDVHRRPLGVLDQRILALEWPPGPLGALRTPVHSLLRGRLRPVVRSGDDLATVARTMLGASADALPVVDQTGRLAGLVTLWHYARAAADAA